MGRMAIEAAFVFSQGFVRKLDVLQAFSHWGMTSDTQVVACFEKQKPIVRSMGAVALAAIAFHHHLMPAAGFFRHNFGMTAGAQRPDIFFEKVFIRRGMRIMAAQAFVGPDQRVGRPAAEILFLLLMALQAVFAPGARFEFDIAGGISLPAGGCNQGHQKRPCRDQAYAFTCRAHLIIWQSLHFRSANGLWICALNSFGSVEVCAS